MFRNVFSILSNFVKKQQDDNHLKIFKKIFSVLNYLMKKQQYDNQLINLSTCLKMFSDF